MSASRTNRVAWILLGLAALAGCRQSPAPVTSDVPLPAATGESTPVSSNPAPDLDTPEGRLLAQPWIGDLDGLLERRYIRVLVIPDKMNFFFDGAQM